MRTTMTAEVGCRLRSAYAYRANGSRYLVWGMDSQLLKHREGRACFAAQTRCLIGRMLRCATARGWAKFVKASELPAFKPP